MHKLYALFYCYIIYNVNVPAMPAFKVILIVLITFAIRHNISQVEYKSKYFGIFWPPKRGSFALLFHNFITLGHNLSFAESCGTAGFVNILFLANDDPTTLDSDLGLRKL